MSKEGGEFVIGVSADLLGHGRPVGDVKDVRELDVVGDEPHEVLQLIFFLPSRGLYGNGPDGAQHVLGPGGPLHHVQDVAHPHILVRPRRQLLQPRRRGLRAGEKPYRRGGNQQHQARDSKGRRCVRETATLGHVLVQGPHVTRRRLAQSLAAPRRQGRQLTGRGI